MIAFTLPLHLVHFKRPRFSFKVFLTAFVFLGYLVTSTTLTVALSGCKPTPLQPILESQRESLKKAEAVQGILQQHADQQRRDSGAPSP